MAVRIAVAGVLLTTLLGCSSDAATNLVLDPEFDAGPPNQSPYLPGQKLGQWTVVGDQNNAGNVVALPDNYPFTMKEAIVMRSRLPGGWSVDLTGTLNKHSGVSQQVATSPGQTYRLGFWVGNVSDTEDDLGVSSTVQVYVGTTLLVSATNSDWPEVAASQYQQVWAKFTATFVATSAKTTLTFINGDPWNDGQCGLDSISLEQVSASP